MEKFRMWLVMSGALFAFVVALVGGGVLVIWLLYLAFVWHVVAGFVGLALVISMLGAAIAVFGNEGY